jgi:hypothetical protein
MLPGALDLLILRSLVLGPAHGRTIAHAIERPAELVEVRIPPGTCSQPIRWRSPRPSPS